MPKLIPLAIVIFFISLSVSGQETSKQIYSAPNLKDTISKHTIVAILPFTVSITYKRPPKNFDATSNQNEELSLGKNLQTEMFTYLLRKRDKYTVEFQDVDQTNALLRKAGVWDRMEELTADSLAIILKVSSVIKCNYAYEKTSSEGGAIVKTLLFGGLGSKTASGLLTMQIKNGSNGILLWRFSKTMDETAFSSANQLMERMMKKVSRNFPYEK
jgi:hypothetical protein